MELCLGTAQLGMDYGVQGDKRPSIENALALIDMAFNHGIATFDTATAYGEAEKIIGMFLLKNNKTDMKIISKMDANALQGVTPQRYNQTIIDGIKHSLQLMGTNKLDAYYFHNASHIYDTQKLKSLYYIKELGLAKNTGISVYRPQEALAAARSEYIDYIQVPYNPLDQRLDKNDFFHIARQNSKKVFIRSVFLQGLLTMNILDIPFYAQHAKDTVKHFREITQDHGYTPFEGCLAFIKANPLINYYVIGVSNQQQLCEIVDTFNAIKDIPNAYLEELQKEFSDVDEQIINPNLWKKQ